MNAFSKKNCLVLIFNSVFYVSGVAAVQDEVWLNVFVHGACASALSSIGLTGVQHNVRMQYYQDYSLECIGPKGFVSVNPETSPDSPPAAHIIKSFDAFTKYYLPRQEQRYYLYGWNGQTGADACMRAALLLAKALREKISIYKQRGLAPRVRLLAHGHGGIVSLLLGACSKHAPACLSSDEQDTIDAMGSLVAALNFDDSELPLIDQLVLFGMPVRSETAFLATAGIFSSVLHIASLGDWIRSDDQWFCDDVLRAAQGRIRQCKVSHQVGDGTWRALSYNDLWSITRLTLWSRGPLDPLPFVVVVPAIMPMLASHEWPVDAKLHIEIDAQGFSLGANNTFYRQKFDQELLQKECAYTTNWAINPLENLAKGAMIFATGAALVSQWLGAGTQVLDCSGSYGC